MRHASNRVILFHEVGGGAALIALALAAIGFDVRYLKLSGRLRSDRAATVLDALSITPLSYESVDAAAGKYFRCVVDASGMLYREVIESPVIESVIGDAYGMTKADRIRFSLACEQYVLSEAQEFAELMVFAREINRERSPKSIQLITVSSPLSRAMIKQERRNGIPISLLPLPKFALLGYLQKGWAKYLQTIRNALTDSRATFSAQLSEESGRTWQQLDKPVLFFPHKGIYYGTLFAKDHYYAADVASPFHHKNILHLSLGEPPEERADSDAYYRTNGLINTDLNALAKVDIRRWSGDFVRLLWGNRNKVFSKGCGWDAWRLLFYFARYCHLRQYLSALDRLPGARIALVGYDILFPPMLSVALGTRHVTTVATQERFFAVFQGIYRIMFDHYLVMGPRICDFLRKSPRMAHIGNCEPIGPVRAESILDSAQSGLPDKYSRIKSSHFLILALDWHCVPTAVENARVMTNHWKTNRRFYLDMIGLASRLPSAYVVIKGKEVTAATLPAMRDIMEIIERMPNISVETDLATYSPSIMAGVADLTVACHTSLVDEVLAVGKPALTYDYCGFPTAFFDYDGYPFIVKTYSELLQRVSAIMQGEPFMDDVTLAELRRVYFSQDGTNETPRKRLKLILDDIYRKTVEKRPQYIEPTMIREPNL